MNICEDINKMRDQILNLRSALIASAKAIYYFSPRKRPGRDHLHSPEARAEVQQIYEEMNDLVMSARMVLGAVLHHTPQLWDRLWRLAEDAACVENEMAEFGWSVRHQHHDFMQFCAEMDRDMVNQLETTFSEGEWRALTAEGAWQEGRRLPQVMHLLKYLEDRMAKQFDLLESIP